MNVRIVSTDESSFQICVTNNLWAATMNRFGTWEVGDYVIFRVDGLLAGYARVTGQPFASNEPLWQNDLYPYRLPIAEWVILPREKRIPTDDSIKAKLFNSWGVYWGLGFVNQKKLLVEDGQYFIEIIDKCINDN